jgi:hypothetical protein
MKSAGANAEPNAFLLLGGLAVAAALAFLLSLAIGPVGLGRGLPGEAGALIFREIRLPRAAPRSGCRARRCRAICAIRWPSRAWSAYPAARRSARC